MDLPQDTRIGRKNGRPKAILTIATPVVNDFDSWSQTMVGFVNQLGKDIDKVELLAVDNDPTTGDGYDTRKFCMKLPNCRYVGCGPRQGTFVGKEMCMQNANTEYVLVCDSHIVFQDGALLKLLRFLTEMGPCNDLFHGPICNERWEIFGTHMNPALGDGNFGRWGSYRDENGMVIDNCELYKVPMQGMGVFLARRDTWPGFHPALFHFGSEEGYIHEKYRLLGREVWSIPFLKWWHRFRQKSIRYQYPMSAEHKYRNYHIAWTEVGLPLEVIEPAYIEIPDDIKQQIRDNVVSLGIRPIPKPANYVPFLGYPIRMLNGAYPHLENYRDFEKPIFAM
jgi:hypothetical protein